MNRFALLILLVFVLALAGCGSKKPEVSASASIGDADAGTAEAKDSEKETDAKDEMEPEADTGPVDYPEPPKRSSKDRKRIKFKLWVKKANVLPLSEDGRCWDTCSSEAKNMLVDSLTQLSGDRFASSAKALTTAMSAKDSKPVLPDIYVHIDCGFGQEYTTHRTSAEDRIAAKWRGAKEELRLDPKDQCAISVWDADDDEKDELLGTVTLPIIEKANSDGEVIITGGDEDFGQVQMVELFLDQLEGTPVWTKPQAGDSTAPVAKPATKPAATTPESKPSPGSKPQDTPAPAQGAATYTVEVVKANLKKKKAGGQPWDSKIPFVGGGTMPDPFVEVYVNGYQSENPFMATSVARDTVYKEWRETGTVNLKSSDKLHFMVWDKDKLDHDLMGECISDTIDKVKLGRKLTFKGCSQVDFLVVKITRK